MYRDGALTIENGYDLWFNKIPIARAARDRYTDDLFYDRMAEILRHDGDDPLFVYLAFETVHTPNQQIPGRLYPECDDDDFTEDRQIYCNKVKYLDTKIGQIVKLYKDKGLWDDTILIFTTDNGGMPHWNKKWETIADIIELVAEDPDEGKIAAYDYMAETAQSFGCNLPYRAGKGTLFEGGVKGVGFINGGKNVIPSNLRGTAFNSLMHVIDFLPTIISGILGEDGLSYLERWMAQICDTIISGESVTRPGPLYIDIRANGTYGGLIDDENKFKYFYGVQGYDAYYPCNGEWVRSSNDQQQWLFDLSDNEAQYEDEEKNVVDDFPILVMKYSSMIDAYVRGHLGDGDYMHEQDNTVHDESFPENHYGVWAPWLNGENRKQSSNFIGINDKNQWRLEYILLAYLVGILSTIFIMITVFNLCCKCMNKGRNKKRKYMAVYQTDKSDQSEIEC